MKLVLFFAFLLIAHQPFFAQEISVKWSKEFKTDKNSDEQALFAADLSGLYLSQKTGSGKSNAAYLTKMNHDLQIIFQENYSIQLKGKKFEQFVTLKNKVYLLSSAETNSRFSLYGTEVDNSTGKLANEWVLLNEFDKTNKYDKTHFLITYNSDSSAFIICATQQSRSRNEFLLIEVSDDLQKIQKTLLYNTIDPSIYQLEELIYTPQNKILMIGKVLEYQTSKKNRKKLVAISNYNIELFDNTGKSIKVYKTSIDNKWFSSAKVFIAKDKIVLASFYNIDPQSQIVNGLMIQNINPATGEIINTISQEINPRMIEPGIVALNPSEETIDQNNNRIDFESFRNISEDFSSNNKFRDLYYTEQGDMYIIAENYFDKTYELNRTAIIAAPEYGNISYNTQYESGDLYIIKINNNESRFEWLKLIPKKQSETNGYLFSGFTSFLTDHQIHILFNDNPSNAKIVQPGQDIAKVHNFSGTHSYLLSLDLKTENITRKPLFSNINQPVMQPQRAFITKNRLYFTAQEQKSISTPAVSIGVMEFK